MRRLARNQHFSYEQEHIDGDLRAVRVFLGGCTYRVLYAREDAHDQILLAVYAFRAVGARLDVSVSPSSAA